MSDVFINSFTGYLNNTDGKKLTGTALLEELAPYKNGLLLDVGAGRGELSTCLAPFFKRVVSVEPKGPLAKIIRDHFVDNIEVAESTIQDFQCGDLFDVVLLSYFLDSFSVEETNTVMKKITGLKKPDGTMLGVTYYPNCSWDRYTQAVCEDLGIERKGGFHRVSSRLERLNYSCKIRRTVQTGIYGKSPEDLYYNLSFFFKSKLNIYLKKKEEFMKILNKYSELRNGMYCLNVEEVIFEITAPALK